MERLLITGFVSLNVTELLAILLTVTTTAALPAKRPFGTTAVIELLAQLDTDAAIPPNVTVLLPCVEPKLPPVMVTEVPCGPEVGEMLAIPGPFPTMKKKLLPAIPLTVTRK